MKTTIIALIVAILVGEVVCLWSFHLAKKYYKRNALRSWVLHCGFFFALCFYAFGELLPRIVSMPCWVVDFMCLTLVPTFAAVQWARNATFLILIRLTTGIMERGVVKTDEAPAFARPTFWWSVKVTAKAVISLLRPESSMSTDNFNRLEQLRELRFLASTRGQLSMISCIIVPSLFTSTAIVLCMPTDVAGCWGCRRDYTMGVIMSIAGSCFVCIGLFVAYKVKNYSDSFGMMFEGRLSIIFILFSLIFYMLDAWIALPADPNSFFTFAILTTACMLLAHSSLTVLQLVLSARESNRIWGPTKANTDSMSAASLKLRDSSHGDLPVASYFQGLKGCPSLLAIMSEPSLAGQFQKLLAQEFGYENLVFLQETYEFTKNYFDSSPSARLIRAKRLQAVFVDPNAPMAINLPSEIAYDIKQRVRSGQIDSDMFNDARQEIARLLETGPVMRFESGHAYRSHQVSKTLNMSLQVATP